MSVPSTSDAEFTEMFETYGANETARRLKVDISNVFARRRRVERRIGRPIRVPGETNRQTRVVVRHPQWINIDVRDGIVLVGSDAHVWPGEATTAQRGFVKFAKEMRPKAVILNGDVIDGARISRHPPLSWENRPTLIDEIEAAKEWLHELSLATPRSCKQLWTCGNHDARFEIRLATVAPEYAKVHGMHLKDNFPAWEPCWSVCINEDVVVKHRYRNGVHATWNNTIHSGKSIVTGHLHSAKVTPFTDYNGTRFGVDTGCLAEPYDDQFEYCEDNPRNWVSAFAVLTFRGGRLMWPELAYRADDGVIGFRGELIRV
jgi:hypothetical protein